MAKKIKWKVDSLEEVDEPLRELYDKVKDEDGTEVFVIPDLVPKTRLDEFRTNNRNLFKKAQEAEDKLKTYEGVDPEEYRQLKDRVKKLDLLEDADLIKDGKLDEVLEKRTKAMRDAFQAEKDALVSARDNEIQKAQKHRQRLRQLEIERNLLKAAQKAGKIKEGAEDDIIQRATRVFDLDDEGKLIPTVNGQTTYGESGSPITPEEWSQRLLKSAPHLFGESKGGGSGGGEQKVDSNLVTSGDVKILKNPSPTEFGKYSKEIAAGKIKVVRE